MSKTESDSTKREQKKQAKWVVTIFCVTILVSATISFLSNEIMAASGMLVAFLILLAIVAIGIVFDIVGVAVTSAVEKPFHSMASRRVPGAKEAIALLRNAGKVSSICNDVVGDICGIVSGATGAVIVARLQKGLNLESVLISVGVTALISGATIGGKALGKPFAMNQSKRVVHLDAIKRVRLPAPRRLSPELQKALEARMNRQGLKYMPQVFENGWYCACGAFHPKEEDTVYCTECGCDRILLQNALNTLLQPEQPDPVPAAQPEAPVRPVQPAAQEEPTRIMSSAAQEEATRVMPARPHVEQAASFAPPLEPVEAGEQTRILDARNYQPAARAARPDDEGTRVMPAAVRDAAPAPQRAPEPQPVDEEDYEEEADSRDSIAETLIRWVPPITAIICAGIALWGFVYYQFIL